MSLSLIAVYKKPTHNRRLSLNLNFILTGHFCPFVLSVHIHRPFLLINRSNYEVVLAKSVIDISIASLLASIIIIF
jgi:hypothetical protein